MLSPSSMTIAQGGSATTTVTTTVVSGVVQALTIELGAMPVGMSWKLSPASPLIGMAAILTLYAGTVVPGTYTVPVVAKSPQGVIHQTDLTFTVTLSDFAI